MIKNRMVVNSLILMLVVVQFIISVCVFMFVFFTGVFILELLSNNTLINYSNFSSTLYVILDLITALFLYFIVWDYFQLTKTKILYYFGIGEKVD